MLLMLLRPQGATATELEREIGDAYKGYFAVLNDQKGWDVRSLPNPDHDHNKRGRHTKVFKIVGKVHWNGKYRSFLKEPKHANSRHR